jgi:hypothetical protein
MLGEPDGKAPRLHRGDSRFDSCSEYQTTGGVGGSSRLADNQEDRVQLPACRPCYTEAMTEHPCDHCGNPTKNPRFCGLSCAASVTGREKPRRGRKPNKPCTLCGLPTTHRSPTIATAHRDCLTTQRRQEFLDAWLAGSITVSRGKGHNRRLEHIARMILLGRADHQCEQCGWSEVNPYTGKVPLEIDHINGDPYDDRYENFKVLCPNCHALTSTYKGANRGNGRTTMNAGRDADRS